MLVVFWACQHKLTCFGHLVIAYRTNWACPVSVAPSSAVLGCTTSGTLGFRTWVTRISAVALLPLQGRIVRDVDRVNAFFVVLRFCVFVAAAG